MPDDSALYCKAQLLRCFGASISAIFRSGPGAQGSKVRARGVFEAFSVLIHRSPEPFVPTRSTGHRFKIGALHSPWKGLAAYKGSEPLKEPVVHHKLSVTILDVCAYTHTHIYMYVYKHTRPTKRRPECCFLFLNPSDSCDATLCTWLGAQRASPVASSPLVQNFNAGVSSPGLQDVPEGTGLGEQTGRALGLGF